MRLLFVRHGESEANRLRVISNRDLPHPLTELGCQQAAALAEQLRGAGVSAVYTSPVPRAAQTAAILAQACGLASQPSPALREFDCGEMEGRSDAQAWAAHRHVTEAWTVQGDLSARVPGGESFIELRDRFVPFVESLLPAPGAAALEGDMVLVSHGGLLALLLPLVLANVSPAFARAHGVPHTRPIVAQAQPGGLVCLDWAGAPLTA